MSNSVSAKILRKKVDDGAFGVKRYSFMVAYQGENKWISAFADPKKISPDVIDLLRELGEGDRAEFALMENKGKDGKIYHNIIGVVREKDVNDDFRDDTDPAKYKATHPKDVQPDGQKPKQSESDTRIRSMALAYAKDWGVSLLPIEGRGEGLSTEELVTWAKRFESPPPRSRSPRPRRRRPRSPTTGWTSPRCTSRSPGAEEVADMPILGGLMGNMFGGSKMGVMPGKWLDLSLYTRQKPAGTQGTHAIPPGQNMGASLPLEPRGKTEAARHFAGHGPDGLRKAQGTSGCFTGAAARR